MATVRDQFNAFINRHEVAWELTMAGLAVLYVAVGFALDAADPAMHGGLIGVETALTVVFVAEFGSRFAAARDRPAYLRGHWLDLVALIPVVRGVRLFRLLRLLRLVRAFAGVHRALAHVERLVRHRGLAGILVAWLAVMVICSIALFVAENGVNEAVASPWDAMWWGITTMTTVGYGDVYPITPEGRIAAGVLMLLGIGLFSVVTATITSFFLATGRGEAPAARLRRVAALHADGLISDEEFERKRTELLEAL